MIENQSSNTRMLEPPVGLPGFQKNDWFALPHDDPLIQYLVEQLWDQPNRPLEWEAARLSKAAYLYREKASGWIVLVKFYSAKVHTMVSAERYARNEFDRMKQVDTIGESDRSVRAPRAIACQNGVLFLEYIDGLTLEDKIAIRRNRPGTLLPALDKTARLLSGLHKQSLQLEHPRNFHYEIADTQKNVAELAEKGILAGNPVVAGALQGLIERWAADPAMIDYIPTFIHGDATTSNFVFSWSGDLVAIDWERMNTADPASELGRLMAEVAHSIQQYSGDYHEAQELLRFTSSIYCQALPSNGDRDALLYRSRFYQASSTLRIARNGWLPALQRTGLAAQALALLAYA
jgi:thiamine kinase-like enzyme